jgi:UDP-glucose 4-epimerase
MRKILVLGGLGFIGSNIIEKLLSENDNTILVFDFPGVKNPFEDKVFMYYGDFDNEEGLERIFKTHKIDIVIHLISTTVPFESNSNISYDIEANLLPSIKLLNLCVKHNVGKIIFFSSGGTVYGIVNQEKIPENHPTNPISSHGIIKLTIEKYIQLYHYLYGINFLIVRPGNAFGPYQKSEKQGVINVFLRKIIRGEKLIIRGDGESVRDYIYVKDLAWIINELINKNINNTIVNIGSGIGLSVNELLSIIKKFAAPFEFEYIVGAKEDIPRIVLNINKLASLIDINLTSNEIGILETYNQLIKKDESQKDKSN